MTNTDRMMTRKEVEQMINIKCTTIYRWMQEGTFPSPVRFSSRCVRWRESDVRNWVDEHAKAVA
ncbi:MAG: AlpA family phage regulatory protein [Acetobacter sp.]|uniref:helix-turn-helix transcriptional regulator n=1 Tax=Acetobacter sp. TaxID=440 RepID=UPI0039ECD3D6